MINAQMKSYNLYTYSTTTNAYGEETLGAQPSGTVKMAINAISDEITDSPLYHEVSYIGLTFNKNLTDSNLIAFGDEKLKVKFVKPFGRYNQVFLQRIN